MIYGYARCSTNETKQELIELYNLLSKNIIKNKYLLGINTYDKDINYEELMDYLILNLKDKIYDKVLEQRPDLFIKVKNSTNKIPWGRPK